MSVLVVAQLLSGTETVVKGGRNLEIRYGLEATRASTDLDAIRVESLDDFAGELEAALEAGWAGFSGRLVDKGEIDTPGPVSYRPHRFEVKLTFEGRSFDTVKLEVGGEEAGSLESFDSIVSEDGSDIFAAVGLPEPEPVPALPLPVQTAQKIHACTTADTETWVNDRAHDLVDLQLIRHDLDETDLPAVRVACERLFATRQLQPWPPEVSDRPGWSERYAREREGVEADVAETVADAVVWTNQLIDEIASA